MFIFFTVYKCHDFDHCPKNPHSNLNSVFLPLDYFATLSIKCVYALIKKDLGSDFREKWVFSVVFGSCIESILNSECCEMIQRKISVELTALCDISQ